MALHEYLGWEAGFTLEKESQTLALVLKDTLIVFAFDNRETLMRWQVMFFINTFTFQQVILTLYSHKIYK